METYIVVFDERSDASQTSFEGRKNIGGFRGDVKEHLRSIDNPPSLCCEGSVEVGPRLQPGFIHGPEPIPVPLASGGRFRKMADMNLGLCVTGSSSSLAGLGCLDHGDITPEQLCHRHSAGCLI